MLPRIRNFCLLLILLLAQSCSSPTVFGPGEKTTIPQTPTPSWTPTPLGGLQPPASATLTPGGPLTLRVWAPPQFDPAQDNPAARLLRARLDEFTRQRPRVRLEVRIKALQGPGGLLDALTTAKAAAPQAAPDLIALPRDLLEIAALKGLLTPFNPSSYSDYEKDWYPYARDLARLQDSVYGLPFAGDALALTYRPASWPISPATWANTLQVPGGLVFHAADPQALLTLAYYQSKGGPVRDEQSKPMIDSLILTEVLTYYLQAEQAGVIPVDIAQIQNDEQAWAMFRDTGSPGVITWTSRFLNEANNAPLDERSLAPLPTADGQPYALASGWVWALSSPDAERQRVSVELARFLTDGAFLNEWTASAGQLPPYIDALEDWSQAVVQPETRLVLDQIARSAQILPPGDILTALSGVLRQATMATITGQSDPATAAQQAAAGLTTP
jgi:ABC-type glycerol-3-phosphate transport system substrate-binding protein